IDGVLKFEDFAFNVYRNLLGEVAISDGGSDVSNFT
ncbi:MAG: hypothetical protein JWP00_3114, partial [Chloroflexi bacterium]|nr:hypothetical protein [Chloroflexota bacterium]